MHNDNLMTFAGWASAAMAVQLLAYGVLSRILPELHQELENNNMAVGALLGGVSLTFGIINAACLS
jgi:putative membrane protein